jgi:hypothetical protein
MAQDQKEQVERLADGRPVEKGLLVAIGEAGKGLDTNLYRLEALVGRLAGPCEPEQVAPPLSDCEGYVDIQGLGDLLRLHLTEMGSLNGRLNTACDRLESMMKELGV